MVLPSLASQHMSVTFWLIGAGELLPGPAMRGSIERPRRNDENDGTRGTMSLKRTELAPKADDTGVLCVLCVLCHYKSEGHGLILAGIGGFVSMAYGYLFRIGGY